MARLAPRIHLDLRLFAALLGVVVLALLAARPAAALAKDGGDVRVAAVCSKGASSELRLKSGDGGIEVRFRLRRGRVSTWRVVLVQERRVAFKGTQRTAGSSGSFELRRTLPDLTGADAITATAWGPQGLVCRATATLPGS